MSDAEHWWARKNASALVQMAGRSSERDELSALQNIVAPPPALVEQGLFAYSQGMFGIGPLAELWRTTDAETLRRELAGAGWAPAHDSTH